MAPSSWTQRWRSVGSTSSSNNNSNGSTSNGSTPPRNNNYNGSNGSTYTSSSSRASSRPPPQASFDPPPTLHHGDKAQASPSRQHGRSVSHPLPRIFGRKKSSRELNAGSNDSDVQLDDDLVPVMAPQMTSLPLRVISGKKGRPGDDVELVTKNCICCDSKITVPKDVDKFRCVLCLTVMDLKPPAEQRQEMVKQREKLLQDLAGDVSPGVRLMPLSEPTVRMIIDKCTVNYLVERCKRQEPYIPHPPPSSMSKHLGASDPLAQVPEADEPMKPLPVQRANGEQHVAQQLTDAPLASSPPDTPDKDEETVTPSATIRDFKDLDHFSYTRTDTPPPEPQQTIHGPGPPKIPRKPVPAPPSRKPPPPPVDVSNRTPPLNKHPNGNTTPNTMPSPHVPPSPRMSQEKCERQKYERAIRIFKPVEEYLLASFGDYQILNTAFSTVRPQHPGRAQSESSIKTPPNERADDSTFPEISQIDAKVLMLGDLGENSSWWTGKVDRVRSDRGQRKKSSDGSFRPVTSKSPNINWKELYRFYSLIHEAGADWQTKLELVAMAEPGLSTANLEGAANIADINDDLADARKHVSRVLLKVSENVLKRPTQPLNGPEHMRFLILILSNPALYATTKKSSSTKKPERPMTGSPKTGSPQPVKSPPKEVVQHTAILKRVFGLMANSSESCHRYLTLWFARYDQERFEALVDLVARFVTHRIQRSVGKPLSKSAVPNGGLIPDLSGSAANTSTQLHNAIGLSGSMKKRVEEHTDDTPWADEWQLKAVARVMSLLFAANNTWQGKRREVDAPRVDSGIALPTGPPHEMKARRSGQLLHTSQFYNTLLDYHDLIADFLVWESKRDKFAFCQYPLFLSMGTKIKILEYDAHRQMEVKAREAWFDSVIRQSVKIDTCFHLHVRRDCLADDSLRQISAAVGAGQEELKKGLRVHFTDEEGVDAGGLRKEWFLMLVREIFHPDHDMFVYDDESHLCYFNPYSFEKSEQFYLVGALLGLAIYNSTILDVAFPPFAFRKLLASAPSAATGSAPVSSLTGTKGQMTYTIADLAELRPGLAAGLQQLLEFEGDVQETYGWDFVAPVERFGTVTNVPLIANGENIPVTNDNRERFVDEYIKYILDSSVVRQFEPFKRGFFTVCAGNALSLFRAEEIELLVRGSDESLDVDSLRAVASYENWRYPTPPHMLITRPETTVPAIRWFWDIFKEAPPEKQRKLLVFITGSDRIPAVGTTSLVLRVLCGGGGWEGEPGDWKHRFPVGRTCFNMIVLQWYESRAVMEEKIWRAVEESQGFGLK
jgi:E3 ubiquitin-protein ligase HECTD2